MRYRERQAEIKARNKDRQADGGGRDKMGYKVRMYMRYLYTFILYIYCLHTNITHEMRFTLSHYRKVTLLLTVKYTNHMHSYRTINANNIESKNASSRPKAYPNSTVP